MTMELDDTVRCKRCDRPLTFDDKFCYHHRQHGSVHVLRICNACVPVLRELSKKQDPNSLFDIPRPDPNDFYYTIVAKEGGGYYNKPRKQPRGNKDCGFCTQNGLRRGAVAKIKHKENGKIVYVCEEHEFTFAGHTFDVVAWKGAAREV